MRFIPKRLAIIDEGLEVYLERTKDEHNEYGYDEFIKRLFDLHEPKTTVAKAFGVNKKTIYNWLEVYEKEKMNV